jgi:uncharacterized protein YggU (UPF0235/DUF167 family)
MMMNTKRKFKINRASYGAAITIQVTPASKNEIVEILDDGTIRLCMVASAGKSSFHQELLKYLAAILEVPIADIEVVAEISASEKLVSIVNIDAETVQKRVLAKINTSR